MQIRDNNHGHRIDSLAMMCVALRKASLASWRWSMVMRIPRNYRPVKRTNFNATLVDGLHHITFSIHSIQICMINAVEYVRLCFYDGACRQHPRRYGCGSKGISPILFTTVILPEKGKLEPTLPLFCRHPSPSRIKLADRWQTAI